MSFCSGGMCESLAAAASGDWAGVALLLGEGRALLAAGSGSDIPIADESVPKILERWSALDKPGAKLATPDAKPLDRLLEVAGSRVRSDLFDIGLAQYVLSPGVGSSDFDPLVFQRLGRKVMTDKEAGIVNGALPAQQEMGAADRWLAERADRKSVV